MSRNRPQAIDMRAAQGIPRAVYGIPSDKAMRDYAEFHLESRRKSERQRARELLHIWGWIFAANSLIWSALYLAWHCLRGVAI